MHLFSDVLLTVDFDRTLTDTDGRIPPRNLEAIHYFMENGGSFTINTGRSTNTMKAYMDVPVNAPLLLYNGSAAWENGQLVNKREIDLPVWETLDHLHTLFPDLTIEVQAEDTHYFIYYTPGAISYYENMGWALRFGDSSVAFSYGDMTATVSVVVTKCIIPLPHLDSIEYNGTPQAPNIPETALYTATLASATTPGSYPVTLTLTDPHNYTFGASDTATVYFVIAPRRITVTVSDVNLHLFENDFTLDWSITSGTLVGSDTITPTFRIVDGRIFADFEADNYAVTVIPGSINRLMTLSRRATSVLFIVILILIAVTLAVIALVLNRRRIACRAYLPQKPDSPEPPAPVSQSEPEESGTTAINAEYADTAITNSLAKDLIRRDDDVVTSGHRHGIVNVDTLSRSFSAGDRVDINTLKSRSLIPYDTAYIKVLARGMIDKPLCVYANDFSLSAVKMIALTGGKAIKVNTAIKKNK